MTHAALLANLLTAVVSPIAPAAGPAPPAAVPERAAAEPPILTPAPVASDHSPLPQIGLGALQLTTAALAGIVAPLLLADAGILPRIDEEPVGVIYVSLLAPTLASAAVWGTGQLSSRYRGRWWPTVLGACAGVAGGLVIGRLLEPVIASSLGVDTNPDVPTDTFSMVVGAIAFMPVGAVTGWHLSKQEVAPPVMATAQPSRNLMLPVISLRW